MFKHIITIALALMLAVAPFAANAAGTLPDLGGIMDQVKQNEAESAIIDFGVRMGTEPAMRNETVNGTLDLTYTNVSNEMYTQFSNILEECGYVCDSYEIIDDNTGIRVNLSNGSAHFVLEYRFAAQALTMIYPKGVILEQKKIEDPFGGYIQIRLGDKIELKDGTLVFVSVGGSDMAGLEGSLAVNTTYECGYGYYPRTASTSRPWVIASFTNKSVSDTDISEVMGNIQLHYINADHDYAYNFTGCYTMTDDKVNLKQVDGRFHHYTYSSTPDYYDKSVNSPRTVRSMTVGNIAAWVDNSIPSLVCDATDGILAITFTVNGTNYIHYIRK